MEPARIVTKPSTNTLGIIYLNQGRFSQYETVIFKESNIKSRIESLSNGSYKNITSHFILNNGQKDQYYDYARIVRRKNYPEPSKRIMIIFDYYTVPSNSDGDIFTVLSYAKERYLSDIPTVTSNNIRLTDIIDFRPRVSIFNPASATDSPFAFSARNFGSDPKFLLRPDSSSVIGYEYYMGRVDKLYLDKYGNFILDKGVSSINPKQSLKYDNVMDLATISVPPYVYSVKDIKVSLVDNKRYTMRDIGKIEDRIENLEITTSLSLLELDAKTFQIKDADGLDRFKTGFFVDDFSNSNFVDFNYSNIEVDGQSKVLKPIVLRNTLKNQIAPRNNTTDESLDLSTNFDLIDPNVKKTGQFITLNYNEVGWIEQAIATRVENVNPFHVVEYSGAITLQPGSDTWVRIIRSDEKIIRAELH